MVPRTQAHVAAKTKKSKIDGQLVALIFWTKSKFKNVLKISGKIVLDGPWPSQTNFPRVLNESLSFRILPKNKSKRN
jgi:hypothetical protein